MLFYYLTRMIVSPTLRRYCGAGISLRRWAKRTRIYLKLAGSVKRAATSVVHPYENDFIAGYLVPVFFIIFTSGSVSFAIRF